MLGTVKLFSIQLCSLSFGKVMIFDRLLLLALGKFLSGHGSRPLYGVHRIGGGPGFDVRPSCPWYLAYFQPRL